MKSAARTKYWREIKSEIGARNYNCEFLDAEFVIGICPGMATPTEWHGMREMV